MKAYTKGLKETYIHLVNMNKNLTDLHPVFQHFLKDFLETNKKTFESEGRYLLGENWEPLNPTYAKYKKKKYGDKPILVATGRLKKSLTTIDPNLNEIIISEHRFAFISKVIVNGYNLQKLHQYGTKKMPDRPIVDYDRMKRVMKGLLTQYVVFKSKGGFGKEL